MRSAKEHKLRAFSRVRPVTTSEHGDVARMCTDTATKRVTIDRPRKDSAPLSVELDGVFGGEVTNQEVFDEAVKPQLDELVGGYNCALFAYGQTGSGKTYTMLGADGTDGVVQKVLEYLFLHIEREQEMTGGNKQHAVKISVLEVVPSAQGQNADAVLDLLAEEPGTKCAVKWHPAGRSFFAENKTEQVCANAGQAMGFLNAAKQRRQVCDNNINSESSRTHMIFTLSYSTTETTSECERTTHAEFNMVDLAGSEDQRWRDAARQRQGMGASMARSTDAESSIRQRAFGINQSLSALANVFRAVQLHEPPPYRQSKLTKLLKNCIGGNSCTRLIVTLSPTRASTRESISTLQFAKNASMIVSGVEPANVIETHSLKSLQLQVQQLQARNTIQSQALQRLKETSCDGDTGTTATSAQHDQTIAELRDCHSDLVRVVSAVREHYRKTDREGQETLITQLTNKVQQLEFRLKLRGAPAPAELAKVIAEAEEAAKVQATEVQRRLDDVLTAAKIATEDGDDTCKLAKLLCAKELHAVVSEKLRPALDRATLVLEQHCGARAEAERREPGRCGDEPATCTEAEAVTVDTGGLEQLKRQNDCLQAENKAIRAARDRAECKNRELERQAKKHKREQEKLRFNLNEAQEAAEATLDQYTELEEKLERKEEALKAAQVEVQSALSSKDADAHELRVKLADAEARAAASESAAAALASERDEARKACDALTKISAEQVVQLEAAEAAARDTQVAHEEDRDDLIALREQDKRAAEKAVQDAAEALKVEQAARQREREELAAARAETAAAVQELGQLRAAHDATKGDTAAQLSEWEVRREADEEKLRAARRLMDNTTAELQKQVELRKQVEQEKALDQRAAAAAVARAEQAEAQATCARDEALECKQALQAQRERAQAAFRQSDEMIDKYGAALKDRDDAVKRAVVLEQNNLRLETENRRVKDENAALAGHQNQKQKIRITERLRNENVKMSAQLKAANFKVQRLQIVLAHERHAHEGQDGAATSENVPANSTEAGGLTRAQCSRGASDDEVERALEQMKRGDMVKHMKQKVERLEQQLEELRGARELRLQLAQLVGELQGDTCPPAPPPASS